MTIRNPDNITSKVTLPAGITPANSTSEFPTHYADFGAGGLRTVETTNTSITEISRDDIPAERRQEGMMVYVSDVGLYYRLSGGIENSNWVEFEASGGSGHIIENAAGDDLAQRANLQFVGATVTDDAANDRTIVEVTQGERIVIGEDQFKVETDANTALNIPRTNPGELAPASTLYDSGITFASLGFVGVKYAALLDFDETSSPIHIVEIANPTNVFIIPADNTNSYSDVRINGETAYFVKSNGTITSRTVGNQIETTLFTGTGTSQPLRVSVIGSTIYFMANGNTNVRRVDTTTTSTLIASLTNATNTLVNDGTHLYISDGNGGSTDGLKRVTVTGVVTLLSNTFNFSFWRLAVIGDKIFGFGAFSAFQEYDLTNNTVRTQAIPPNTIVRGNNSAWGITNSNQVYFPQNDNNNSVLGTFGERLVYTQTIALPNVTINTDTDKYVYNATETVNTITTSTLNFVAGTGAFTVGTFNSNSQTNSALVDSLRINIDPTLIASANEILIGTDTVFTITSIFDQSFGGNSFSNIFGSITTTGSFDFATSQNNVDLDFRQILEAGQLEIIDEEHYDMNFSLNITNSASYTGTDYQLFLDIDGLNSGTIVNELVSGTTTYNVTVPVSIHRGNDIRIREFVPDATTINAITTSWSAGSSWAVDEATVSGLQTAKVTLVPTTPSASQSVTHNLNNNYLTVWVVYNGRTASPRQEVINTFTIASNDTIDVTGLATDADIVSYTFLIQGF